jgi:hypothetical protein
MSNKVHAEAALQLARMALGKYKSNNKIRPGETKQGVDREERWGKADRRRGEIQRVVGRPEPSTMFYEKLAEVATAYKAGNCTEYAAIAWRYLVGQGVLAHIVGLEGGDHAFAVVGLKQLPSKDFTAWGEDVWICDPWANICCPAADYPKAWNEKMARWDEKEKLILDADGEPIRPTEHSWLNSIQHCEKAIRTGAPFEQAQQPRRKPLPPLPRRPDASRK